MPQIQGQAQASTPNTLRPVHVIPPRNAPQAVWRSWHPPSAWTSSKLVRADARSSFATPAVVLMPRCHTCSMQCHAAS